MVVESVRLLITLIFTAIGFRLAPDVLSSALPDQAESAGVVGAVVGAGVGYVLGGIVGRQLRIGIEKAPRNVAPDLSGAELFTGAFGVIFGIVVGAVLALPAVLLLPAVVGLPLAGLIVFILAAVGARLFASRAEDLIGAVGLKARSPLVSRSLEGPDRSYLIDSSAAIDGRILDLVRSGLVEGQVWIPGVVLDELQSLADSGNQTTRRRGRRGLDVITALQDEPLMDVSVLEETVPEMADVDAKLIALCERSSSRLVTTDHNLAKAAELRGVLILNPNVVAEAVKATVEVGQLMRVPVSRKGSEPGQGVGYLDDGTMVVIEGAAASLGQELDIEITSTTRTSVGRMLFARVPV